jgi:N-carbamoylputrescine amidase
MVSRSRAAHRVARRQILFYPTAIGWHPSEKRPSTASNSTARGKSIQRSHAVANGCYVAAVNRIGKEVLKGVGGDGIEFWGQSFVAGTSGEIISKASVDQEEIMIVPVDLAQVDVTRTHWPFLRDRRIDAYGDITATLRPTGDGTGDPGDGAVDGSA